MKKEPKNKLYEYHELLKLEFSKFSKEIPNIVHEKNLSFVVMEGMKKNGYIKSVTTLKSPITHFYNGVDQIKNKFIIHDRTGLFKVVLNTGDIVVVLKYPIYSGAEYIIRTMYCTSIKGVRNFTKLQNSHSHLAVKPEKGIYNLIPSPLGGIIYKEMKELPQMEVFHSQKNRIHNIIDGYFSNLKIFTRFGKTGGKRVLIYGKEGTGKTSIAYEVAKKHSKDKCVVFCTDPMCIVQHTKLCAKHSIPTIVVAEECDKWLGGIDHKDRPNSEIKAYMDGHLANMNKKGELFLLITNYPKQIESTILLRPGRVHEKIEVGPTTGEDNLNIAKLYFKLDKGDEFICQLSDLEIFKEYCFTGAQIERISQMCLNYSLTEGKKIDTEVIKCIITEYKDELENLKNFKTTDEQNGGLRRTNISGFSPPTDNIGW